MSAADQPGPPELERQRLRSEVRKRLFKRESGPVKIGRYVITGNLGSGGMGMVYAARDTELDRPIALKVLRAETLEGAKGKLSQTRLIREARAIAKVSHPNVAAVYETGTHGAGVYIAMEFVDGVTLRRWLAGTPRPWRSIVEVFLQAGRGLAAAHRAGIVHRDFKPDNVLVGPGGSRRADRWRVRVVDFGLARAAGEENDPESTVEEIPSVEDSAPEAADPRDSPWARITRSGTVLGTPAYMAPEQRRGVAADARSDQFSFCVALYEAVRGRNPLLSDTDPRHSEPGSDRNVDGVPVGRPVPRWLRKAVARGLETNPSRRYADMEALVETLEQGLRLRQRGTLVGAVAIAILAGVGVGVAYQDDGAANACADPGQQLEGSWNEQTAGQLESSLAAGGAGAVAAWRESRQRLDAWAAGWVSAYADSCRAHDDGPPAAQLECLNARRDELESLVGLLREGSEIPPGSDVTRILGRVADCRSDELARATLFLPADPAKRRTAISTRLRLAHVERRARGGQMREALDDALGLIDEANDQGLTAIAAEAQMAAGSILNFMGQGERANKMVEQAGASARAGHHLRMEARAWIWLARILGTSGTRFDDAMAWAERAKPAIDALGGDVDLEIDRTSAVATISLKAGRYSEAVQAYTGAINLERSRDRPDEGALSKLLSFRSAAIRRTGDTRRAAQEAAQAVELGQRAMGPDDPELVTLLINLANSQSGDGDDNGAYSTYMRALATAEAAQEQMPFMYGQLLSNAAALENKRDNYEQGLDYGKRSLAVYEKVLPPDHADIAGALHNLGAAAEGLGERREAAAYYQRSLDIKRRALPDHHPKLASTGYRLGRLLGRLGRADEGIALLRAALEVEEAQPQSPSGLQRNIARELAASLEAVGNKAEAATYTRQVEAMTRELDGA